jgi:flagellar basal-body rod protein FlgC
MSAFSSIDIGRTGIGFAHHWMDAIAHNLANVNTVRPGDEEPFRARLVAARALQDEIVPGGSGVALARVVDSGGEPARTYDPGNPLADAEGYVVQPVVDLAGQLSDLIIANRTYQANLKTIETGREAYQAALRLGQR